MFQSAINSAVNDIADLAGDRITQDQIRNIIVAELGQILEQGELFNALLDQERIRVVTQRNVGEEKYQHLAVEMWTKHLGTDTPDIQAATNQGKQVLTTYLETQARALRKAA